MLDKLRTLVGSGERDEVVKECRDCGTVVDGSKRCPSCDSADIARYEIS